MAYSVWLLLVLVATFLFYIHRRFYTYDRRFMELASKIPGPRRLPFIGSAYVFGLRPKSFFKTSQRIIKTYQSVFSIWIGPVLYTIVSNPKDFEAVLSSNKCNEKEEMMYHFLSTLVGDGMITSRGERWKKHRRMLNPIFSLSNLQGFVDIFYLKARETYDLLEGELDSPSFNIYSYNEKFGINVLFATVMTNNDDENEFAYEKSILLEYINNGIACLEYRGLRPWLYFDFIYYNLPCSKQLQSNVIFLQDTMLKAADYLKIKTSLNEKKKDILESESNCDMKGSILQYLLQLQAKPENNLTDQDIMDETLNILGAELETSIAATCFILFQLSRHQEVQDQIVNEICHYFGSLDDKPITYNDLSKLHYLDRVVKEGLRLYPTIPYICRNVSEETTLSNGTILPRGSNVFIYIFNLHRDPESFPNPEKFDPDNFLPENVAKRSKYAYAPFSHGPRNCIGQKYAMLSIKTQLVVILRRFCVTPTDIEPELHSVITLKPKNGIHVGLQKRAYKEE